MCRRLISLLRGTACDTFHISTQAVNAHAEGAQQILTHDVALEQNLTVLQIPEKGLLGLTKVAGQQIEAEDSI